MKAMQPSLRCEDLATSAASDRVVKKLWLYVKKNNLQDKKESRTSTRDDALREVFGGKKTSRCSR